MYRYSVGRDVYNNLYNTTNLVRVPLPPKNMGLQNSDDVYITGGIIEVSNDPTKDNEVATKHYVDSEIYALPKAMTVKEPARAATTENIFLTGLETSIDGVQLNEYDRVLVKNQTNAVENGVYNAHSLLWERTDDFNENNITAASFIFVEEGTTLADTGWVLVTDSPIDVNTTQLEFIQFSAEGTYTAGIGLTKIGTMFELDANLGDLKDCIEGNNSLGIGSNDIHITNGINNICCGKDILSNNSSGNSNIAFGKNLLLGDNAGSNNTALGHTILLENTSGDNNTAVGNNLLKNNDTGSNNTALGHTILSDNTIGSNNTAVGN